MSCTHWAVQLSSTLVCRSDRGSYHDFNFKRRLSGNMISESIGKRVYFRVADGFCQSEDIKGIYVRYIAYRKDVSNFNLSCWEVCFEHKSPLNIRLILVVAKLCTYLVSIGVLDFNMHLQASIFRDITRSPSMWVYNAFYLRVHLSCLIPWTCHQAKLPAVDRFLSPLL